MSAPNMGLTPAQLARARSAARLITRFGDDLPGSMPALMAPSGDHGLAAAHLHRLHAALHPAVDQAEGEA